MLQSALEGSGNCQLGERQIEAFLDDSKRVWQETDKLSPRMGRGCSERLPSFPSSFASPVIYVDVRSEDGKWQLKRHCGTRCLASCWSAAAHKSRDEQNASQGTMDSVASSNCPCECCDWPLNGTRNCQLGEGQNEDLSAVAQHFRPEKDLSQSEAQKRLQPKYSVASGSEDTA